MRKSLTRALAVTAAIATTSLAACTSTPASPGSGSASGGGEQKVIGLAVANLQANFFNQIRQSVEAEGTKQNVKVIVADAGGDSEKQVSQIQDLITQQVDALIYIPAGATAATVPVKSAKAAGIPVVTVDRNPDGAPGDTFIATDSVAAAKTLAEWVVEQTKGEGNLGVIQGQIGTTPELARDEGFKAGLEGSKIVEVARQASEGWHQDEGHDIAQDMLQAHPEINIIFGRADALALGAAQAARQANRKDILIVGFDGDTAGLEAVRDGVIAATMTQKTQYMGQLALESALKLAAGEKVAAEQLQPAELTTKENVAPFIEQHP